MLDHNKLVFIYVITTVVICISQYAETSPTAQCCIFNHPQVLDFPIYLRDRWEAREPKKTPERLTIDPAPYIIIHHSDTPGCEDFDSCSKRIRSIQNHHMDVNGWDDIGYNILIGGDGGMYEGRELHIRGAHSPDYNNRSVGICFIGDFQSKLPNSKAINTAKQLITLFKNGIVLTSNYTLLGHRQTRATDCPGDALYNEIKTWSNWKDI
uniref:Peptidoglycan-recognition protein n=1 Tax=Leguminivora glycinivorella TaxID=1035111 RepID=A0A346RAC7_9NEOP|nr:peptidoglycan recognition protein SD2 [Leguminivora glycinivorella]